MDRRGIVIDIRPAIASTEGGAYMPTSIVRKSATVAAVAGAIVLLASGSAFAATVYSESATPTSAPTLDANCSFAVDSSGTLGATGCFKADGDRFYIKDNRADGHHVEVRGQINTSGNGIRCYENRGSAAGWLICDSFWDNIPENAVVAWTVGVWEGGTLLYAGQLKLSAA
jgi:hypothetical protein